MPDLVSLPTPIAQAILCWFAETTLVASALALLASCGGRLRRPGFGPAARHALWLVVLVKLLTPPLVHWPWSLPWPTTIPNARPSTPIASRPAVGISAGSDESSSEVALGSRSGDRLGLVGRPGPGPRVWSRLEWDPRAVGRWVVSAWVVGSIAIGVGQAARILRFRRRLREAVSAPTWLVDEADRVGERLGVRAPEIRVVPCLGTPLLWCLGRPVLLAPRDLVETLTAGRWRGLLAHELAHLRRGDHWVSRLELVAGLVWWWNPLYWLALRRLDDEAESACDAWVVWALPQDRLTYAESLVRICASLSPARSPTPSLGVAGAGRSFERRLTMILSERVPCRLPAPGLFIAALLAVLALPAWTVATPVPPDDAQARTAAVAATLELAAAPSLTLSDDPEDEDGDEPKAESKPNKKKRAKAETGRTKPRAGDADIDSREIEKSLEKALGPDFEKKMEALGEEIGREMEKKFGPGSDFEKKMKAFGEKMGAKFGPGSDFEKKMKAMSEEMTTKFGPGSDFEKKMKAVESKVNAKVREARAKEELDEDDRPVTRRKAKPKPENGQRAQRIKVLEARINELTRELKQLKSQDEGDDED